MTSILFALLFDSIKAILGRVVFAAVSERFMSRIVCWGLRSIAAKTTNGLAKEAAEEIIGALRRPDLPKIK